jgi:hypothetical protein
VITIVARGVRAVLESQSASGKRKALSSSSELRVQENDVLSIEINGFRAGSRAQVWVFSAPTLIGFVQSGDDGEVVSEVAIPGGLANGRHRLVIEGTNNDNENY